MFSRLLVWSSHARSARSSHPHNLIAAVDINDLAGDRSGAIAPEKDTGLAQLGGVAGKRDQRVSANSMRGAKCFACRAQEIAFQCFSRRERKRVQHQVEPIGLAAHLFKKTPDLSVTRDVAGKEWCFFSKFIDEFLDVLF